MQFLYSLIQKNLTTLMTSHDALLCSYTTKMPLKITKRIWQRKNNLSPAQANLKLDLQTE